MISIRPARREDAETLSELLCASIRELCAADHRNDPEVIARWTGNKTPEHMARWIANPRCSHFLASRDAQPAGVGSINDEGEVLLNYVAPAHRFCGVSHAVLTHLEALLVSRGVRIARLTSTETAHRFYLDAGWKDTGDPQILLGLRGYSMAKDLQPASDTTA